LQRDVANGVHRIGENYVNWYVLEEGGRLTVVDAGLPAHWNSLLSALSALGRSRDDVEAVILTHAHFDHVGFAEKARTELGVPVYVHENDAPLTKRPWMYFSERSPVPYFLRYGTLPIFGSFLRAGALWTPPIKLVRRFGDGETLDVPGSPRAVFTPGHTLGHVAFHLPERGAVISGDALVTFDPYTGLSGPRVVARSATADAERALDSLDILADLEASAVVLPGHGEPWKGGLGDAVARARRNGLR
jgi:glyoxylase-like metal-dependent hydrolase (beta-lactamase superfamily II)